MIENETYDYRGKRALVLLRVSTEEQEKKYGFPAQLRSIHEKLIEPYGLRIPNEETHIIRDTYTGMEFREREALLLIREMAQRREFDVLVTDVLDRLGRTGMPREIYRAELKMLGIHFLTTKEEEHADDDSMLGQMIRLWHGWKSEGERNDIVRRTQDGKRERVLKDHKLAGAPEAKYGWRFKDEEKGTYVLNDDPKNQWIYLPEGVVPPILVTDDGRPDIAKFERVQQQLEINQKSSARNNQQPYCYLLRGGFIKCGYCGRNMVTGNFSKGRHAYRCYGATRTDGVCSAYNFILAHTADALAWEKVLEIIRDPSEVDRRLNAQKTTDPNAERRQYIAGELVKVEAKRKRLKGRIEDEDLDDDTYTDIKLRLKELADLKRGYESELNIEINVHEEWKKTQDKLKHFHKRCQEMLDKLHDSNYEPDYAFKRDAIEFLGIVVYIWKPEHDPKFTVQAYLPSIVSGVS